MLALHVDDDPRDGEDLGCERARLIAKAQSFEPIPSVIIDSGGGYQSFWLLKEPVPVDDAAKLEAYNRALATQFAADHCFNIDRIMRLPGTINLPNRKKRAKGRKPALARVVKADWNLRYTLDDFAVARVGENTGPSATTFKPGSKAVKVEVDKLDMSRLPEAQRDDVRVVIREGKSPRSDFDGDRSDAVFYVCCALVRADVPDEQIVNILLDRDYCISDHIYDAGAGDPPAYAARQLKRALEREARPLPLIRIAAGELPRVLDEAEAALRKRDIEVFQRAGTVVRVTPMDKDTSEDGVQRRMGALLITEVTDYWLREKFMEAAEWQRHDGKKGWVRTDPKLEHARHYRARVGEWRLPVLRGIVEAPTLRPDFTVLDRPGYDPATQLTFDPGDAIFPEQAASPTRADAEIALAKFVNLIRCFPFVPDDAADDWEPAKEEGLKPSSSRSVVLSAFLTGLMRRTLRSAPLHAIDAHEKGTGKSLIADIVAILLTGRCATVMSQGHDSVEDQKRLFSVLRQGDPVLVIDNVERPVEGDALCSILTQEVWQSRILGESEMKAVPTNCLIIVTGNNLTFRGDITRRVLICRMDARTEHPDKRQFNFDPREIARERRGELVAAGLTMARAYIAAGRPTRHRVAPLGSFEEWTLIREVLVWLGQPDPAASRERVLADDPAKMTLAEMMEAWGDCFDIRQIRVSDAVLQAQTMFGADKFKRLMDVMTSACNGRLNAHSLGWWFKGNVGKIVEGRRFQRRTSRKDGTSVRLEWVGDKPS
jgi:hypothetical protein